MIDLGNLGITSNAHAINNHGQIVGGSRTSDGTIHGFIWEGGGPMVDLNDLIPPNSSLTLDFAVAINDRGTIAGLGRPPGCDDLEDGCGRAYLLAPDGHCDDACEQNLAEHERERTGAAPLACAQYVMSHPGHTLTPTERVRNTMRQQLGVPGAPPTLRY
jgi:probable HAF family extracellular repeat protein